MTEVDSLKSQLNGPTLPEKVLSNRNVNNTILANSRSANTGGNDLSNVLADNPRLTKNSQGQKGSLNAAIRNLDVMKSFST